jgi:hypothetical protein
LQFKRRHATSFYTHAIGFRCITTMRFIKCLIFSKDSSIEKIFELKIGWNLCGGMIE